MRGNDSKTPVFRIEVWVVPVTRVWEAYINNQLEGRDNVNVVCINSTTTICITHNTIENLVDTYTYNFIIENGTKLK